MAASSWLAQLIVRADDSEPPQVVMVGVTMIHSDQSDDTGPGLGLGPGIVSHWESP